MFFINNKDMPVGAANFYLKDGDVVRLRFTLYGIGADLGNGRTGSLSLPNLDAITKRMAVYNANRKICDAKGYASVYASAKSIVTNMDSTPTQVEQAYAKLPTEAQMIQWAAEQAAKEKAEADRKKYTPAKTKIKKITSKKKQAKLTWKKITGATGYEIEMSKKLGLNGNRIHIKVEVPRKLYWADKLGLLIMADTPNFWGAPTEEAKADWEH